MLVGKDLGYEIGNRDVFSHVDIAISKADKVGLIGPNGAGKSSLLQILSGVIQPTQGRVMRGDVEVGLLPQDLNDYLDHTVHNFVEDVTGVQELKAAYHLAEQAYTDDPDNMEKLSAYSDAALRLGYFEVETFEARLSHSLRRAGLSDSYAEKEIGSLSGGQRTRVALTAIMSDRHDVILLDEPTNNLDHEGITILENFIEGSPAAFLMVSHDRRFLRSVTTRIVELLGNDKGVDNYKLGYDEYVEARANKLIEDQARYDQHELVVKSLTAAARRSRIRANSANSGGTPRKDNDKLTANFRSGRAASSLSGQARGIESRIEQLQREAPEEPEAPISLDFSFDDTEVTRGKTLLNIKDLRVSYQDATGEETVFGPYNLQVRSEDKIAITGANGTGKSTLVKSIIGVGEGSVSGDVSRHPNARIGYIDQSQSLPHPELSPLQNLMALAPEIERSEAMHLLVEFNFNRDTSDTMKASNLSGGERAKLLLASIVANKANLLILDEPTNNLDIPTIEALQEALSTYKGAVVLVSHDRDFVEGIGTTQTITLA